MSRVRDIANILSGGSSAIATDAEIPSYVAGKNLIINGGMDIWQRGTSFTVTGLGYATYTVDRWTCYAGAAGTITQDTSLYAPGSRYGLRFTSTVASSAQNWYQMIETTNAIALAGQTVCMSLYAAGTAGVTGHYMNLQYSTNVDAGLFDGGWTNCNGTTIAYPAMTGAMQRHIATFSVPNNAKSLRVQWTTGLLTNTQFQTIGGFQLEIGSVATPFTRSGGNISGELASCQRYYWRTSTGGTYKGFGLGTAFSTTQARCMIQFPQTMRITPSSVEYGGTIAVMDSTVGYTVTSLGIDGNVMTPQSAYVNASVASGLTQYRPYFLYSMADANAYVGFSAEL